MIKEKLIEVYHEMHQDKTILNATKVEFRAFLNRRFRANIKPTGQIMAEARAQENAGKWAKWEHPGTGQKKTLTATTVAAVPPVPPKSDQETEQEKIQELRAEITALGGKYHGRAGVAALTTLRDNLREKANNTATDPETEAWPEAL